MCEEGGGGWGLSEQSIGKLCGAQRKAGKSGWQLTGKVHRKDRNCGCLNIKDMSRAVRVGRS